MVIWGVIAAAVAYGVSFIALVVSGHEAGWTYGYGFVYSSSSLLVDSALGVVFFPVYGIAHGLFGICHLFEPMKILK